MSANAASVPVASTLTLGFALEPFGPDGANPANAEDFRLWIEDKLRGSVTPRGSLMVWAVGSEEPGPDFRTLPWLRFDETGRFLGVFDYSSRLAAWVLGAAAGTLMTKVRAEETVALDMEISGLAGWAVCNGAGGTMDLTANDAFFQGTAPDWDLYTVMRL